jgi:hypothetical protein
MNYNYFGIIIPVIIYIIKRHFNKCYILLSFIALSIGSLIHAYVGGNILNVLLICGASLLFLYNGKRGKTNLKYFFYLFYPLHFVLVYGLNLLIN